MSVDRLGALPKPDPVYRTRAMLFLYLNEENTTKKSIEIIQR